LRPRLATGSLFSEALASLRRRTAGVKVGCYPRGSGAGRSGAAALPVDGGWPAGDVAAALPVDGIAGADAGGVGRAGGPLGVWPPAFGVTGAAGSDG